MTCARCAEKDDEVRRLKRELATANARALPRPPARTVDAVGVQIGGRGKVSLAGSTATGGHGVQCQCIGCRAGRADV